MLPRHDLEPYYHEGFFSDRTLAIHGKRNESTWRAVDARWSRDDNPICSLRFGRFLCWTENILV